jgi:hypothetical protein
MVINIQDDEALIHGLMGFTKDRKQKKAGGLRRRFFLSVFAGSCDL